MYLQPCHGHKGDMMNGKSAELKTLCEKIFKDMVQKNTELGEKSYGFHFTYSPEKSWRPDTKVLLLTLNPQSWDGRERRHKPIIPSSPWPGSNAFLDRKKSFPVKNDILTILAELGRAWTGRELEADCEDEALQKFVDDNVVLASYVPFRTPSGRPKDLPREMKRFAKENYWNRILPAWQPELVIATGTFPFNGLWRILKKMTGQKAPVEERKVSDYQAPDTGPRCRGKYRVCTFTSPSGKGTRLLGVPHPAASFGLFGFPTMDGRFGRENAPIQNFLREELEKIPY